MRRRVTRPEPVARRLACVFDDDAAALADDTGRADGSST